jgi:protein-L-isoaspartate(D-aspartate) O-methyltransferase
MVREHMEARGIRNRAVLDAIRQVPRERFVPQSMQEQAYQDSPLPIGHGQTISQPYIVAAMTELVEPDSSLRVLEIGTGSGYQAAVLSLVFKEVYTIEIVPELGKQSQQLLNQLGYKNVHVRIGDGYKGWPEKAPFDRIMLTAAPPEVPQALIDQLATGGKLVAPVGSSVWNQELIVLEKSRDGKISRRSVFPVRFVPMVPGKK